LKNYKERLATVKNFTAKNRLFSLIAIALVLFLLGNAVAHRIGDDKSKPIVSETEITETESEHWRFYPVDLGVLVVGGGFCSVMIIRERKKAREKLQ
jgi:hypothetical protein